MCGIIGFASNNNNISSVIAGLKKLEYRGYDSAGIAGFLKNSNEIKITKSTGKITNLEDKLNSHEDYTLSIAHTRWATHGIPNEINAHPHTSENITLVHNGIIENYSVLKELLISKGYVFYSETDTEVACKYIDYIYTIEKNKEKAILKACKDFKGSYALAIIFNDDNTKMYGIRYESPLVLGVSDKGNFISSDVSSFLNITKDYILLQHNQLAIVDYNNITILDENLNNVNYEITTATWESSSFEKNGYEHFMLKEINEQPKIILNIFNRYLNNKVEYFKNIDFTKYDNIHIVACGSAMHTGLVGKYLIETYANIPVKVDIASEYRYSKQIYTKNTLVIIISQSGETADSLAALRIAKESGIETLAIVNAVGSTISREADNVIYTYAGPEIAVATTKGYTSQIAVLTTIAFELSRKYLKEDNVKFIINEFLNIDKTICKILADTNKYMNIADSIYTHEHLFFIGRGIDYAVLAEASLKLKEISYIHSETYAAGELKHGTISLIEKSTPVISLMTDDKLYEKTISNIKETKARGSFVISGISDNLTTVNDFCDISFNLPFATDFTSSFSSSVVFQLIAYYTAKKRNCDIDKPRNLAKSVTVE